MKSLESACLVKNDRRRPRLQLTFATFPSGCPGAGLLLLRAALGFSLIAQALPFLIEQDNLSVAVWISATLVIISGTLLLIGYLTPSAGSVAALSSIALWYLSASAASLFASLAVVVFEVAIAIALACLGPGSFSVDARLFGRREIIIPRSSPHVAG